MDLDFILWKKCVKLSYGQDGKAAENDELCPEDYQTLYGSHGEKGADREVIGKQLLRCATSVGANYRAACLAKSRADFLNKIKICEEEADESEYWLELIVRANLMPAAQLKPLREEAHAIASIMASAAKTTRESSL